MSTIDLAAIAATAKREPRPMPKAGSHPARVMHVVDLGLQARKPFKGVEKGPARQVWVNFELVNSEFQMEGETVRHRVSTRPMSVVSGENAAITKFLSSIDPSGNIGKSLDKLANSPCLVNIVHVKGVGENADKTYANLTGATPVPEGFPVKELSVAPAVFSFDTPTYEAYSVLPPFVQDWIKGSLGFKGSRVEPIANKVDAERPEDTSKPKAAAPAKGKDFVDDKDIPF